MGQWEGLDQTLTLSLSPPFLQSHALGTNVHGSINHDRQRNPRRIRFQDGGSLFLYYQCSTLVYFFISLTYHLKDTIQNSVVFVYQSFHTFITGEKIEFDENLSRYWFENNYFYLFESKPLLRTLSMACFMSGKSSQTHL